jgi:hypothetical protein
MNIHQDDFRNQSTSSLNQTNVKNNENYKLFINKSAKTHD